ncbi:hypothetical protein [Polymorphobacter sp.]|uniref:hypothetical protein n=1 Tax=Polymorphobacter sp. TaxID=1909290 RepID=UPI003F722F47
MSNRPDSEKITINLGFVDLGHVDLLVREGFYGNRSDFIRTAIRNQLARHDPLLAEAVSRQQFHTGLLRIDRTMLETAVAERRRLNFKVLGLLSVAADVDPSLITAAIAHVEVLGAIDATPAVRASLRALMTG